MKSIISSGSWDCPCFSVLDSSPSGSSALPFFLLLSSIISVSERWRRCPFRLTGAKSTSTISSSSVPPWTESSSRTVLTFPSVKESENCRLCCALAFLSLVTAGGLNGSLGGRSAPCLISVLTGGVLDCSTTTADTGCTFSKDLRLEEGLTWGLGTGVFMMRMGMDSSTDVRGVADADSRGEGSFRLMALRTLSSIFSSLRTGKWQGRGEKRRVTMTREKEEARGKKRRERKRERERR